MVALSVSISARISPFFTESPTFLCQSAITPSVIVSLNRGIRMTSSCFVRSSPAGAALPQEERAAIDNSVAALKESVSGDDYKLIRKRIDELNHATERLAELVMNGAVSTALEGRKLAEV